MEDWLKRRRGEINLTQEELASKLQLAGFDIARATVGHWETGKVAIPLHDPRFIKTLSGILYMPMPTILKLAGFEFGDKHHEISEEIAYLVDDLPPEKQELALRLVQQLTK